MQVDLHPGVRRPGARLRRQLARHCRHPETGGSGAQSGNGANGGMSGGAPGGMSGGAPAGMSGGAQRGAAAVAPVPAAR